MCYDVAVIGLGPSGTTFLKCIEDYGLKVIAFDSSEFPRKKLCAGGLTRKAYHLLKRRFPDLDLAVRFKSYKISLFNDNREIEIESGEPFIYMTDRQELDYLLFRGVADRFEIHTGEKVLSIEKSGGFWKLRTDRDTYVSKVVISSDGVNSRIANQLKVHREIGMTYEADVNVSFSKTVIDFSDLFWGYFWIFPKGDFVTVGFGELKRKRLNFSETLGKFLLKHKIKSSPLGLGFPIPAGKSYNRVFLKGVLFLGDSGGLVDPLTGEGIFYAARSAEIAAECIKKYFDSGNMEDLSGYERRINEEFGSQFRWARISGNIFFRTKGFTFKFLERDYQLRRIVSEVVSGNANYKGSFLEFAGEGFKSILRF